MNTAAKVLNEERTRLIEVIDANHESISVFNTRIERARGLIKQCEDKLVDIERAMMAIDPSTAEMIARKPVGDEQ